MFLEDILISEGSHKGTVAHLTERSLNLMFFANIILATRWHSGFIFVFYTELSNSSSIIQDVY